MDSVHAGALGVAAGVPLRDALFKGRHSGLVPQPVTCVLAFIRSAALGEPGSFSYPAAVQGVGDPTPPLALQSERVQLLGLPQVLPKAFGERGSNCNLVHALQGRARKVADVGVRVITFHGVQDTTRSSVPVHSKGFSK